MRIKTIFKDANFKKVYTVNQLKSLSLSDIYFTIGLEEEKKMIHTLRNYNPELNIIDISHDIKKLKRADNTVNPYIWTDPLRVRKIASNILKAVVKLDHRNEDFYMENYKIFLNELDEIFVKIKKDYYSSIDSIYIFDDYWQYYINRFDINTYMLEKKVLKAKDIPSFIRSSKKNEVKIVLAKKDFNYYILRSVASNAGEARVVEDDIFAYAWHSNLIFLTKKIINKK